MSPHLALLLGCGFAFWLLLRDMRWRQLPSRALWIPGLWLALASSRQISFWLATMGIGGGFESNVEGSPINVVFDGGLFVAALLVLRRRRFNWTRLASVNKALFLIFAFFLISVLWSPLPVPTLKRIVREFGCVLTAAIILTETDPEASLRVVYARVSYLLFPLSEVFIRFFPDIGRNVSGVSGTHMLCGVAGHKNLLGQMTMVFCLVLLWDLLETRARETAGGRRRAVLPRLLNLGIGLHLLVISRSATALLCFLFGLGLLFLGKRLSRMKNARRVFMLGVFAIVCLLAAEQVYGISQRVSQALERGENLSGRRQIWEVILEKNTSHLIGAGFRGFWETAEGESVSLELGTNRLLTAHNGYLEVYLHGGMVALILLGAFFWSAGVNATSKLVQREPLGRMAILFWPILLVYNVTESALFQIGSLWFTMLLVTMDTSWQSLRVTASLAADPRETAVGHLGETSS